MVNVHYEHQVLVSTLPTSSCWACQPCCAAWCPSSTRPSHQTWARGQTVPGDLSFCTSASCGVNLWRNCYIFCSSYICWCWVNYTFIKQVVSKTWDSFFQTIWIDCKIGDSLILILTFDKVLCLHRHLGEVWAGEVNIFVDGCTDSSHITPLPEWFQTSRHQHVGDHTQAEHVTGGTSSVTGVTLVLTSEIIFYSSIMKEKGKFWSWLECLEKCKKLSVGWWGGCLLMNLSIQV